MKTQEQKTVLIRQSKAPADGFRLIRVKIFQDQPGTALRQSPLSMPNSDKAPGSGEGPLADAPAAPEQLPPEPSEDASAAVASVAMYQSVPGGMPSISVGDSRVYAGGQHVAQGPELAVDTAAEPNPHEVSAPGGGQPEETVGHGDLQVAKTVGGARGGLKSWTAAEVTRTTPAEVRWIARPWVAEGALTLVDGKPKVAGKSTWVAHLVKHVLMGSEFLDEPTTSTPVVLLSEERPVTLRRLLERVGLADSIDLHVIFYQDVRRLPWDALVKQAVDKCREVGAKLLIIDTWHQFAGIPENSSRKALEAIRPLHAAAEQGLAVVAVRHERKSGGAVGDSGRGSSATTGAADIVVALQRPPNYTGQVRIIHTLSRYEETPPTLVIELGAEGYIVRGEFDVGVQVVERALLLAVPDTEADAKTADELMAETDQKKTAVREALARMVKEGTLMRAGTGRKNEPYRYWRLATS